MQLHIVSGVPVWGEAAGAASASVIPWQRHIKSVYPTFVLDESKSGSFNITVKDEATIGAFGYDITCDGACAVVYAPRVVSYSVRLRVARSTVMGTCQSLDSWDG